MKKLQLAKTFLKVEKIIDIVLIPVFGLLAIINLILGIIGLFTESSNVEVSFTAFVECITFLPMLIIALIFVINTSKALEAAKSKEEIKKPAILSIVAGALASKFGIVAGILLLCTKDDDYK